MSNNLTSLILSSRNNPQSNHYLETVIHLHSIPPFEKGRLGGIFPILFPRPSNLEPLCYAGL